MHIAERLRASALESTHSSQQIACSAANELDQIQEQSTFKTKLAFIRSFDELMTDEGKDGEEIAFHACRGEVVLVESVTNLEIVLASRP